MSFTESWKAPGGVLTYCAGLRGRTPGGIDEHSFKQAAGRWERHTSAADTAGANCDVQCELCSDGLKQAARSAHSLLTRISSSLGTGTGRVAMEKLRGSCGTTSSQFCAEAREARGLRGAEGDRDRRSGTRAYGVVDGCGDLCELGCSSEQLCRLTFHL